MKVRWFVLLVALVAGAFLFVLTREEVVAPEVARPSAATPKAVEARTETSELPVEVAPGDKREAIPGESAEKGVLDFSVRLNDDSRYSRPVEVRVRERRGQALGEPVSFFFDDRGWSPVIEVASGVDLFVDYIPLADRIYREFKPIALEVAALAPGETRVIELRLEETHPSWFVGRVIDRETGEPIGGARIGSERGLKPKQGYQAAKTKVTADEQGLFTMPLPPSGYGRRHVALADGWSPVLFNAVAGHEEESRALDITMIRSAQLRLTLEGIEGLESPVVTIRTKEHAFKPRAPNEHTLFGTGPDHTWSLPVDGRGQIDVELPGQATFTLELKAGDRVRKYPSKVHLEAGETRELVWSVGQGARVFGRLMDDLGTPIPGADLWLVRDASKQGGKSYLRSLNESMAEARVWTDAGGGFEFTDVDAGSVRIGPHGDGSGGESSEPSELEDYCRVAIPVVIPDGAKEVEVDVVVQRGLKIKGRVLKPDGSPLFGCYIWATPAGGSLGLSEMTDGKGMFELGPLTAGPQSLRTFVGMGNFVDPGGRVVEAGDEDVVIQMLPGSTLSGSVFDAKTHELVQAFVVLADGSWSSFGSTKYREKGVFTWDQLKAGTFTMFATTSDGRVAAPRVIELATGEHIEGIELYVEAGVGLEVYYTGSPDFAAYSITVEGLPVRSGRIKNGDGEVMLLPPGHTIIELQTHDGARRVEEFDLIRGDKKRVEFAP